MAKAAKALFIEENVEQKFAVLLGRPPLLLFVHRGRSSSSWIYHQATLWGGYEVAALNVAAVAIAIRFKPRPP